MAGRRDPPFSAANWIQRALTSMMTPSWSRMATFISSAAKIGLCSCRVKGGWIAHLRSRGRGVLPFYFPAPPTLRLGVMIGPAEAEVGGCGSTLDHGSRYTRATVYRLLLRTI